jgi:hypothetical protein
MSHPNTKSMVFSPGTPFEQRVKQRIGVCSDCSAAVNLSEAVQYKATWDSLITIFALRATRLRVTQPFMTGT